MSRGQDDLKIVSLKLSEVLSDIGVNERMVIKRRRMIMLYECMHTAFLSVMGCNMASYCFGSQTEGTTTQALRSDIDILAYHLFVNVIQEWNQWRPNVWRQWRPFRFNLMMIQDETTSPGYCLLQALRTDVPLPLTVHIPNKHIVTDRRGKVLLKNSVFNDTFPPGFFQHGPALSSVTQPGFSDSDTVQAFHCESWPFEAQSWLERQGIGGWPTEEMKRYCVNTGCFVVPVANQSGQNKETEWRISTGQAERYMMYCLNVTQIRCYILMKMILKTFINPQCDGIISSFMCKTVLFHCIQNTHSHQWQENNLLSCLTNCLLKLQHFIREENCPHFIILENNLLAGKLSDPVKHKLLEIVQHIIQSEGRALLEIPYDSLGTRLQVKMNISPTALRMYLPPVLVSSFISCQLLMLDAQILSFQYNAYLRQTMCYNNDTARFTLSGFIFVLSMSYQVLIPDVSCTSMLKKSNCELLFPLLCSSLGSVIASSDIHIHKTVSPKAFGWLSEGLNSDASSGRLKLASALYCGGETEKTEFVLRVIEDQYDEHNIRPMCACYDHRSFWANSGFILKSNTGNEEMITHIIAFCVRFMQCEIDSVPHELQYEMFRSIVDDRLHRAENLDYWMDWAVVDSLPYLYFLQYKTYGRLQRAAGQQCALTYLAKTIETDINLCHRETALNLLGQCMEQESRYNDALRCYVRSLNIRPRNNAAKIHICRLLNALVNRQDTKQ